MGLPKLFYNIRITNNIQTKDIYSEVYSLLNLFGKEYTD